MRNTKTDWSQHLAGAILAAWAVVVVLSIWALTALVFSLHKPTMPKAVQSAPFESRQALANLSSPVGCDATVNGRCYVKGRRK